MTKWSARSWVLIGFVISLSSVVLNTLVMARLNQEIAAITSEQTALKGSLDRMASEIQQAQNKYELVRVFHWVAMQAPKESREQARREAAYTLVNYFTRMYAAVHDVSAVELTRTEMTELKDDYEVMQKLSQLSDRMENATSHEERKQVEAEIDKIDAEAVEVPVTELGKELAKLTQLAYTEAVVSDESELLLEIAPTLQTLRDEFIKNYEAKTNRLSGLDARKSKLQGRQGLISQLAIGLQLMGLFFILSRDVVKDINDKKKAEASKK
jgi:hypothetical protein